MAMLSPQQAAQLGLSPVSQTSQATGAQAFGGQANSAYYGGQTAGANANVAQQTQGADIAGKQAESSLTVLQAAQQQGQVDAIKKLNSLRGSDKFVSPQDYDKYKTEYANQGGDPTSFDKQQGGLRNPLNPNYILSDPESSRIQNNTAAAMRLYSRFKGQNLDSLGVGTQDAANTYSIKQQIDNNNGKPGGLLGLIDNWTGASLGAKAETSLSSKQKNLFSLQQDFDGFYANIASTLNARGLTPNDSQMLQSLKPNIYDSSDNIKNKVNTLISMVGNTSTVLPQATFQTSKSGGKPSLDQLYGQ